MGLSLLMGRTAATINRYRFERAVQGIDKTPPVQLGDAPFSVLSMVQHRDVMPYLLAVKSFCRFLRPRRVLLVADPSLSDEDQVTIARNIPGVRILGASRFHDPDLPRGGTWERLIAISDEVANDYIVQLDADTVALRPLDEVASAIRESRAFTLGTEDNQCVEPSSFIAERARDRATVSEHIQLLAESHIDGLGPEFPQYVRGCSGFAGFPIGSFSRSTLRNVCARMRPLVGERWNAWGTEQFTSNLIIANTANPCVLPHPRYCNPAYEQPGTAFIHFIGYVRYRTGRYAQLARETSTALLDAHSPNRLEVVGG